MNFFMLRKKPRMDSKIPLTTTRKHSGCIIFNCQVCKTRGFFPKSMCGKLEVEIRVKEIAYLDDIEQAGTVNIVCKKFRDVVSEAGLTGVEFYPPVGYTTRGRKPGYQEVIRQCKEDFQFEVIHVTGSGGSVAKTSGVELLKSCDVCGWRAYSLPEKGFIIDESQWDGSDFFRVEEFGPFFMTERAVKALDKANLSNFFAQLSTDYRPGKMPDYDNKKY